MTESDAYSLLIIFLFSGVGFVYFVYGKKQTDLLFMLDGVALMLYPYLVSGLTLMILLGVILSALPFVIRRWF